MRRDRVKGRSNKTYQHKLDKLKKWHSKRLKDIELAKKEEKRIKKELKPLEWYIEKLKKPNMNK